MVCECVRVCVCVCMGRVQTAPYTQSHSSPQSTFELKSSGIGSCWLCEVTQSWKPAECVVQSESAPLQPAPPRFLSRSGSNSCRWVGFTKQLQRLIDQLSTINLITDYFDDWIIVWDIFKIKEVQFSFLNVKMFWYLGNILGLWKKQDI